MALLANNTSKKDAKSANDLRSQEKRGAKEPAKCCRKKRYLKIDIASFFPREGSRGVLGARP